MSDLVIEDLVVEYSSGGYLVRPIDGFDVTVPDGSLGLLLGPSGCGKTTMLSCLAGILQPSAGRIRHGDREITSLAGRALTEYRRHGVGIVFQAFNLIPSLTAAENVSLPMWGAGVPRAEARRRAETLLEEFDLAERRDHLPSELSGGQQQRVAIARALAMDPPLLLADAPTAHLDYVQVEVTLRVLRQLAVAGRVVIVVTHDDRLLPIADQIINLVPHVEHPATGAPVTSELTPGEVLFHQGAAGDLIFVVDEGEIEIIRVTVDGEERLATLGPGRSFGEMAPLFGLPRSATARAVGNARVTGYSVEAFRSVIGVDRLDLLVRAGDS